jgi:hypothetical protein
MLRNQVGISNDLASLLYSRSSAEIITSRTPSAEIITSRTLLSKIITSRTLVSSLDAMTMMWHFSIINEAVQCHILRTFEEKNFFFKNILSKFQDDVLLRSRWNFSQIKCLISYLVVEIGDEDKKRRGESRGNMWGQDTVVDNVNKDNKSWWLFKDYWVVQMSSRILQELVSIFLVAYHKGQLRDPVFSQFRLNLWFWVFCSITKFPEDVLERTFTGCKLAKEFFVRCWKTAQQVEVKAPLKAHVPPIIAVWFWIRSLDPSLTRHWIIANTNLIWIRYRSLPARALFQFDDGGPQFNLLLLTAGPLFEYLRLFTLSSQH